LFTGLSWINQYRLKKAIKPTLDKGYGGKADHSSFILRVSNNAPHNIAINNIYGRKILFWKIGGKKFEHQYKIIRYSVPKKYQGVVDPNKPFEDHFSTRIEDEAEIEVQVNPMRIGKRYKIILVTTIGKVSRIYKVKK